MVLIVTCYRLRRIEDVFVIILHFSFLRLVENTLRYGSLVELVGCTTMLCLIGYCIIGVRKKKRNPRIKACRVFKRIL